MTVPTNKLPESQPSPSGDEWPKDRQRHQADRSPAEIFCTEHPCHDSVIENLLYNFGDDERDQIFAFADKYVAALRSHDAKVFGQAEQRLRATLNDVLAIAQNAPELNMANYDEDQVSALNQAMIEVFQLAEAALQESPSDKTR